MNEGILAALIVGGAVSYLFVAGMTARYCNWRGSKNEDGRSWWYVDQDKVPYSDFPLGLFATVLWPIWWSIFFGLICPVKAGYWMAVSAPNKTINYLRGRNFPKAYLVEKNDETD